MARRKWKWDGKSLPYPDFEGSRDEFDEDYFDSPPTDRVTGEPEDGPQEGQLRVWWIRNVPGYPQWWVFSNKRGNLTRALALIVRLEITDLKRREVTSNVGGIEVYENGQWWDWMHPITGDDSDQYLNRNRARIEKWLGIRKPKSRKQKAA